MRIYKKKVKLYTEVSVAAAVEEVKNGKSVKRTAAKYHISRHMLKMRLKEDNGSFSRRKQGRKTALPADVETKLANCIRRMAELGFGPTLNEMMEMVKEYVIANKIPTPFKEDRPGRDWATSFMKRHRLKLKKGGQMQIARKNVTSDPFVIYEFYELLKNEIERLGIQDRPECVFNCDESGFPSDPSRLKHVGPIGKKSIQVTCGANRENTTVLAVCNANGDALDPLIVFKGKNLLSSWKGNNALPNTYYAVSESGWMTSQIFYDWFRLFIQEQVVRPLLLIFDGHLSHLSVDTVLLAIQEQVSLVKLPAHCTDVLQVLDVTVFSALKNYYEEVLTEHVHNTLGSQPLNKALFTNFLAQVWHKGLSKSNIKKGFRCTGTFPVDASQYKESRIDQVKLKNYRAWKDAGSPTNEEGEPIIPDKPNQSSDDYPSSNENQQIDFIADHDQVDGQIQPKNKQKTIEDTVEDDEEPTCSTFEVASTPKPSRTDEGTVYPSDPRVLLGKLQSLAPRGMKYCLTLVPTEEEVSFENILKTKKTVSLATAKQPQQPKKRISMNASVITSKEMSTQIIQKAKEAEIEKNEKEQRKEARQKKLLLKKKLVEGKKARIETKKARKRKVTSSSEEDYEPVEIKKRGSGRLFRKKIAKLGKKTPTSTKRNVSFSSSSDNETPKKTEAQSNVNTAQSNVQEVCSSSLVISHLDDCNIGKFFAVYWPKPCTYYWGELQKVFADNPESDATQVEIKFLHRKETCTDPGRLTWDWPNNEDIDIVDADWCFAGPDIPITCTNSRGYAHLKFEREAEVMKSFHIKSKLQVKSKAKN